MCWNPQGSGALDVIITLSAVSCKCFFVDGILKMVSVNEGSCVLKAAIWGYFGFENVASFYFYFTVYLYFQFHFRFSSF